MNLLELDSGVIREKLVDREAKLELELFNTISLTNASPFLFEKKEERSEVGVAFLLPSVFMHLLNLPYPAPQWEKRRHL